MGAPKAFIGGFGSGVLQGLFMLVVSVTGSLVVLGGFLAYYLPAIPFTFWMFGVLGWMILIIESLIAAPLWAVAHAVPEGDGFAGRHALQGWQLFVNVIFRPILLILGLLLSMLVLHYIVKIAIAGYAITNLAVVSSTSFVSILAFIFGNAVLVGLVITLAHKSHEIIYETADNVMRWLGFGVHPLGETKGEAGTSRAFGIANQSGRDMAGAMLGRGGYTRRPGNTDKPGGDEPDKKVTGANTGGLTEAPGRTANNNKIN
ncbi:DotA/TraY family protein [Ectothiorhodospira shaposhnikovii]|uniref:DotA/TraY family protein n=1 Tax=Ectothiorhodospira shaposhnikovii TaxID=1054 RepID=UPI001A93A542|nr:DotA/TraY family protein [Ectothiorhodospira shaposhnikovii]